MSADNIGSTLVDRRALMVGVCFAATAVAANAISPRRTEDRLAKHKLSEVIPYALGPWRFESTSGLVTATEKEEAVDGYDQVLTRVYAAPGLPSIMLLIAYGSTQGGSLQLHRPETCYPGQGFRLSNVSDTNLVLPGALRVGVRHFTARRDERVEHVLYWTRIASSFPQSTAAEYRAILKSMLSGVVPDGVLVRLSTIGSDPISANTALIAFANALVTGTPSFGRELIVGR